MYDIIYKKRKGEELSTEEINFFIQGYIQGDIPDYQVSALMMAICFQGMTKRETADLTMAMVRSGDVVNLSAIEGVKVDKHSTGGVGDTTTLIVAPLVAACGIPVAKLSGRGLGHTGGTLDKLESIPGFNVSLPIESFIDIVNSIGLAVAGQTENLVPADKMLYALRDVTATVDSIPLIASSIMSKKIAAGCDAIVLDVKTGSGAFMKDVEDAFELASQMVEIGIQLGRKTTALVTNMEQPLGMAIGNALEVREAIQVLKGMQPGALQELCILLGAYMLYAAGRCENVEKGRQMIEEALYKGLGVQKLREMIAAQGGDERVVDDLSLLPIAQQVIPVKAQKSGYVISLDAQAIGISAMLLGAGRNTKEDIIDPGVGIVMNKRLGDRVEMGDVLAEFYVNNDKRLKEALKVFNDAVKIGEGKPADQPLIYGVVTEKGIERWT